MSWFANLYASSIGKKLVMAITGLIIFGFAVGHMSGNLLIFLGPEVFNDYAHTLQSSGPLLWGTRITLLIAFPLHIFSAIQLKQQNAAARPQAYGQLTAQASTLSSRTMIYGGIVLLLFIAYHILHFTLHLTQPGLDGMTMLNGEEVHDAYGMVVTGFTAGAMGWAHVGLYLAAMVALGLHLYHGVWSALQSMGLNHPKYNAMRKQAAAAFAFIIAIGFSLGPILTAVGVTESLGESFAQEQVEQPNTTATAER